MYIIVVSDIERKNKERLTKREELSLRTVLALPNASRTGLVCTTWSSREPFFWEVSSAFLVEAPTVAKYAITFFVFSVFPAPDSPVINMDWFSLSVKGNELQLHGWNLLTPFFSAYFGILWDPISSDSATVRVILTGKHIDIGSIRNGKNVRWHFVTSFASIKFGASMSIYGKSFVGIDSYTEEARVRLKITIEHCTKIGFIRSNLINR